MQKNYWMLTILLENFRITRNRGFDIQGFSSHQHRKAQRIHPDDRLLYYVKDLKTFAAAVTASSTYVEDSSPVWAPELLGETYPWRISLTPQIILNEDEFLDARLLAPGFDYLKKWTPEDWLRAFQGELHLLPKRDFMRIEEEMYKVVRAREKS